MSGNRTLEEMNRESIEEINRKMRTLEATLKEFQKHNEQVQHALVDIAVALEKIGSAERELYSQRERTNLHDSKIGDIESRLPVLEQTANWIQRGILSLIGILLVSFVTYVVHKLGDIPTGVIPNVLGG